MEANENNIRVVIKIRPLLDEKRKEKTWILSETTGELLQIKDKHRKDDLTSISTGRQLETFFFDNIYGEDSTNADIYLKECHDIVENVMEGFNATIFLYGQTKSGKTYTMLGNNDDPGILKFTLKNVFKRKEKLKEFRKITIWISYLEIYNEALIDLLNPDQDKAANLKINEDQVVQILYNFDGNRHIRFKTAES